MLDVVPQITGFLCIFFKLFIICISLNSFYCLVFKSTDLFFYPLMYALNVSFIFRVSFSY